MGAGIGRGGRGRVLVAGAISTVVVVAACGSSGPRQTGPIGSARPTPPAATPMPTPTRSPYAYPTPTPPPANWIAHLSMLSATSGWAQQLSSGEVLHTSQGVQEWTVASPELPAGQQISAVAYVDSDVAEALSTGTSSGSQTAVDSWSTDNGGLAWTQQSTFTVRGTLPAGEGGLDFVDAEHGWWSVGVGAPTANSEMTGFLLYRTTDGGSQWSEVASADFATPGSGSIPDDCRGQPPVAILYPSSFVNSTTGWITGQCDGDAPYLSVTHDGGTTWQAQTLPDAIPSSDDPLTDPPQFSSTEDGTMLEWGPGGGQDATIYVTADGGQTWTPRSTPEQFPQASDFVDADDGWLLIADSLNAGAAGSPNLYVTHDGGTTWTSLQVTELPNTTSPLPSTNLGGLSLDFVTTQLGWAAPPWIPSEQGFWADELLQTTDGGQTWTPVAAQVSGST
jgi:photosystem II stability/assembly factor-like uncharacterized protein